MGRNGFSFTIFPKSRIATIDLGVLAAKKHTVSALIEVDVTEARRRTRALRRGGRPISLLSWLLHCIAATAQEFPAVHAIRSGRRKAALSDRVDLALPVERIVDGVPVPLVLLIEGADSRPMEEIASEIEHARSAPVASERDFKFTRLRSDLLMKLYYRFPRPLRLLSWRLLLGNYRLRSSAMGSVMVTTLGSSGRYSGWILPKTLHNLCIAIGTVTRKPWVVGDRVEPRDILHLSVLVDHDVIDGAPAGRFTDRLVQRIETAEGL